MMIKSKRVKESRGVVCVEMVLKKPERMAEFRGKKIEISSVISSF